MKSLKSSGGIGASILLTKMAKESSAFKRLVHAWEAGRGLLHGGALAEIEQAWDRMAIGPERAAFLEAAAGSSSNLQTRGPKEESLMATLCDHLLKRYATSMDEAVQAQSMASVDLAKLVNFHLRIRPREEPDVSFLQLLSGLALDLLTESNHGMALSIQRGLDELLDDVSAWPPAPGGQVVNHALMQAKEKLTQARQGTLPPPTQHARGTTTASGRKRKRPQR